MSQSNGKDTNNPLSTQNTNSTAPDNPRIESFKPPQIWKAPPPANRMTPGLQYAPATGPSRNVPESKDHLGARLRHLRFRKHSEDTHLRQKAGLNVTFMKKSLEELELFNALAPRPQWQRLVSELLVAAREYDADQAAEEEANDQESENLGDEVLAERLLHLINIDSENKANDEELEDLSDEILAGRLLEYINSDLGNDNCLFSDPALDR
ncbi:MAG: hypothetical protein M1829_000153 [Trizodia sp. TS-e1964]|nr:MAG: hypothetical protein M1829_000153 [Trizodia sp. TS-e1964]